MIEKSNTQNNEKALFSAYECVECGRYITADMGFCREHPNAGKREIAK